MLAMTPSKSRAIKPPATPTTPYMDSQSSSKICKL
jgi:hypothetical protein